MKTKNIAKLLMNFWILVESACKSNFSSLYTLAGDYGKGETHVPIPNTIVKSLSGDGTWAEGPGRVARCQPFFSKTRSLYYGSFFLHKNTKAILYIYICNG